jgi:tight adherence protein C
VLYLATLAIALSVGIGVLLISEWLTARPRLVSQRLAEVEALGFGPDETTARRRREVRREKLLNFLQEIGDRIQESRDATADRLFLVQAGFRHPAAAAIYWGIRVTLPLALGAGVFFFAPILGVPAPVMLLLFAYFGALGWVGPVFVVRYFRLKRQKEIQLALADALDMLVICVEAGLGLNQALLRVAQEIGHVSVAMSRELSLVNAEIRAGAARDQALMSLADRTGLEDVRSLVTMLIQTDRFGTSIARSLRVHSDVLRQKRRQRAEEAAAKTAIKMVFPLVLCIFPALFVVILGPGLIMIYRTLSGMM